MKTLNIASCDDCPYNGECAAFKKLTKQQRFKLACGVGVGKFILKDCHLSDSTDSIKCGVEFDKQSETASYLCCGDYCDSDSDREFKYCPHCGSLLSHKNAGGGE